MTGTELHVVAPAHPLGTVPISAANPDGNRATHALGFTFGPALDSMQLSGVAIVEGHLSKPARSSAPTFTAARKRRCAVRA